MSTTAVTAGQVMDLAAALLNDSAQSQFTYAVQLPYLRMACEVLSNECQINNIPSTQQTAAVIDLTAGQNRIVPVTDPDGTLPKYPYDLVEIQQLWERTSGSSMSFMPMTKADYIPHYLEIDPPTSILGVWSWLSQEIRFNEYGASVDIEIKMDYIKTLFPATITANSVIGIIGCLDFLTYQTAGLIAKYSGENQTRADALLEEASQKLWTLLGIGTKGRQSIAVRRRPFMQAYKSQNSNW